MALENSTINLFTINDLFILKFEYAAMNTVMRIIKDEKLTITDQKMELNCEITVSVRKKNSKRIFSIFDNTYKVEIKRV